jgi:hypothetical protein
LNEVIELVAAADDRSVFKSEALVAVLRVSMSAMLALVVGSGALEPVVTIVNAAVLLDPKIMRAVLIVVVSQLSYRCENHAVVEELGLHALALAPESDERATKIMAKAICLVEPL